MDECGLDTLLNFLDGQDDSQIAVAPATPSPSQQRMQALVNKESGQSPTDSTRTPSSTEETFKAPSVWPPAGAHAFRRRASSKDLESAEKPGLMVQKPPLYKSASTTSDFSEEGPVPQKNLAQMFNEVAQAKAIVEKEPADKKKANKKEPEAWSL